MSATITEKIDLTVMHCGNCGITHAMPEDFRDDKQRNGGTWYCPNGHPRVYRESDAQKFQRERDEALRKLSAAKCETIAELNRRIAAESELKRHKTRTKNGVCPCCHRSFANLKAHIKTKHPGFPDKGKK